MKKIISAFLFVFFTTTCFASGATHQTGFKLGGGRLSSVPNEQHLKLSLDALNPDAIYDVTCQVKSGGQGGISDAILRFDIFNFSTFGGVYMDDKLLETQQTRIDGEKYVKYRRIRTQEKRSYIELSYLDGAWSAIVDCYAYPSTGVS